MVLLVLARIITNRATTTVVCSASISLVFNLNKIYTVQHEREGRFHKLVFQSKGWGAATQGS